MILVAEMGKARSRLESECGVFSDSEWSRSAFVICWSRSLESNFKIETKNDVRVNCDFDVTTLVSKSLKSLWSRIMILEKLSESNWSRSGVGVRNKRLRSSLICSSAV